MTHSFYRAFEDRHRGSRDLILSRLRVYLPFVETLKKIRPDCQAVDLGCGRGEWLELMREVGIEGRGIDLDESMLAACHERGLKVELGDAIGYLRRQPAGSVAVLTAFHVVEHIPFESLQALVQEALRVLVPAGLLILETPNPENLNVGACTFYYDPTHQQPIPPPLLAFLPDYYGFARTKTLRLQEAPELAGGGEVTLEDVLTGVSPDYAVVAQKGAENPEQMVLFDHAFEQEYGFDLKTLAARFQARIERFAADQEQHTQTQAELSQSQEQLTQTQAELSQSQEQLTQAQAKLSQSQEQLSQTQAELSQSQQQLSWAQAELSKTQEQIGHTQHQIAAVYASTSWRMTAPMRWVMTTARSLARFPRSALLRMKIWLKPRVVDLVTRPGPKRVIARLGRWMIAHPRLSDPIRAVLSRHERLRHRLRRLVLGLSPPGAVESAPQAHRGSTPAKTRVPPIQPTSGINARQRTPLEANFPAYAGGEGSSHSRAVPNIDAILLRIRAEVERDSRG
jgi:O-antigen chain-terminating methyltransferase